MKWQTVKGWFKEWWLLLVPITFASGAVLAYAVTFQQLPTTENPGAWGTFGDFLGGLLNPLVSTLTLFVAISVWRLQKVELEQTKQALEEQAKTAEQQRQEQRFFDLLNVYQRTVESISYSRMENCGGNSETIVSSGKQALKSWLDDMMNSNNGELRAERMYGDYNKALKNNWKYQDAAGMFDHYFRVVFRILSETENLLGDQHHRYVKLFRAQLSRSELLILGFNLWADDEGQNMIPWVEKYGLLKHLPKGPLRAELEKLHPNVFGRRRVQPLLPSSRPESESTPC